MQRLENVIKIGVVIERRSYNNTRQMLGMHKTRGRILNEGADVDLANTVGESGVSRHEMVGDGFGGHDDIGATNWGKGNDRPVRGNRIYIEQIWDIKVASKPASRRGGSFAKAMNNLRLEFTDSIEKNAKIVMLHQGYINCRVPDDLDSRWDDRVGIASRRAYQNDRDGLISQADEQVLEIRRIFGKRAARRDKSDSRRLRCLRLQLRCELFIRHKYPLSGEGYYNGKFSCLLFSISDLPAIRLVQRILRVARAIAANAAATSQKRTTTCGSDQPIR